MFTVLSSCWSDGEPYSRVEEQEGVHDDHQNQHVVFRRRALLQGNVL